MIGGTGISACGRPPVALICPPPPYAWHVPSNEYVEAPFPGCSTGTRARALRRRQLKVGTTWSVRLACPGRRATTTTAPRLASTRWPPSSSEPKGLIAVGPCWRWPRRMASCCCHASLGRPSGQPGPIRPGCRAGSSILGGGADAARLKPNHWRWRSSSWNVCPAADVGLISRRRRRIFAPLARSAMSRSVEHQSVLTEMREQIELLRQYAAGGVVAASDTQDAAPH